MGSLHKYCSVLIVLLWAFLISSHVIVAEGYACHAEEREALLRVRKAAMPVVAWTKWAEQGGSECCEWEGVRCDERTGRVTVLKLLDCELCSNLKLDANCGSLPWAALGRLPSLQVLDLQGGCFSGAIAGETLASLTNLSYLDLSHNWGFSEVQLAPLQERPLRKLTYLDLSFNLYSMRSLDVSQVVRAFPSLTHLDLSYNNLTGVIPEGLSALQQLRYLNLSGNAFQNPVPWRSLGSLSRLRHLGLGGSWYNALLWEEGKADWPPCAWVQTLESLYCENMGFTSNDSLPFCLGDPALVSKLRSLSFKYATMPIGPLLRSLSQPNATLGLTSMSLESSTSLRDFQSHPFPSLNAPFLHTLDLSGCNLTSFPSMWLSQLPLLHSLNLAWNPLVDLSTLPTFPSLTYLDVSACSIRALVLPHLPHLQTLIMASNSLTQIPSALNNLTRLQELDMSYNLLLNGSDLRESQGLLLENCTRLASLTLSDGSLSGGILQSFLKPSLVLLDLSGNNLSGAIPYSIGNLSLLSKLDLSRNSLSGAVPHSIANLLRLFELDLASNSLSGAIPHSLGNLSMLSKLDLSGNHLSGGLPHSIGNLAMLSTLDLSWNQLSGAIPNSVGNLSMLSQLELNSNNLSGAIPYPIGNLALLSTLDLSGNHLSGALPFSIGDLASLYKLDLSFNNLSGEIPSSLGNLSSLSWLDLSQNNHTGAISPSIGSLAFLSHLDLSSNGLSGVLPLTISNLSTLWGLFLSSNFLSGVIPYFLTHLPISELDLSSNSFTGTIPCDFFANLTHDVDSLALSHNDFTGSLPYIPQEISGIDMSHNHFSGSVSTNSSSSFTWLLLSNNRLSGSLHGVFRNCESLQTLDLSGNDFSEVIPGEIGGCVSLGWLFLSSNNFYGGIPEEIGNCSQLSILDLSKNSLSSRIPASIGQLAYFFEALILNSNKLSGEFPRALRTCQSLTVLDLGNNQLTGTIPEWITGENFSSLQVLVLSNNRFYGTMPLPLVPNLTSLRILALANNSLSGSIPSMVDHLQGMAYRGDHPPMGAYTTAFYKIEISMPFKGSDRTMGRFTLFAMTTIDLSNNMLEGNIPPQMGALTGLYSLNLSHNNLSGPIPSTLGALSRALESLDLSNNHLTGSIPEELCRLHFLGAFNVSSNQLRGEIPAQSTSCTQLSSFGASAFADNEGLCGFPLPEQCPAQNNIAPTPEAKLPQKGSSVLAKIQEHIEVAGIGVGYPVGFFIVGLFLYLTYRKRRQ